MKLLEEPGARTLFILISAHRDLILPTIASRTQPMAFSLIPDKELREYAENNLVKNSGDMLQSLQELPQAAIGASDYRSISHGMNNAQKTRADEYLVIANGRPGILIRMLRDAEYAQSQTTFLKEMISLMRKQSAPALLEFGSTLVQNGTRRAMAFEYFARGLRKQLIASSGFPEQSRRIAAQIKRIDRLASLLDSTNVNPKLALDVIMLEMTQK